MGRSMAADEYRRQAWELQRRAMSLPAGSPMKISLETRSNNKAKNAIEESITLSREAQKGCVGLVPGYERPDR